MTTDLVSASLKEAADTIHAFASSPETAANLRAIARTLIDTLRSGGKILSIGNGGSSCDSAHFAEELSGRFRADRPAIAAIACTDAGHITCTANDYGFEFIFSRWVEALGKPGDALILFSTSGNSPNLIRAVHAAESRGLRTVALLGKTGGALAGVCDAQLIAPGATSDRIQEAQKIALHILVEAIEAGVSHA
jgi:D-sedoheptulose 7-phosphate isomerase